jgi:hypothetical protein
VTHTAAIGLQLRGVIFVSQNKYVVVRADSGVFVGEIVARRDREVDLVNYRHIHYWYSKGLSRKVLNVEDLSILGAGEGTTISGEAIAGTIVDVREIITCTPEAEKVFRTLPCLA